MHHGHTGKQVRLQPQKQSLSGAQLPKQRWLKAAGHYRAGRVLPVEADRHIEWAQRGSSRVATVHQCLWAAPGAAKLPHQPGSNLHLFIFPRAKSLGSLDLQSDRNMESSSQSIPQEPQQEPSPPACTQQAPAGLSTGGRKAKATLIAWPSPEQLAGFALVLSRAFAALSPLCKVSLLPDCAHQDTACHGTHLPANAGKGQHTWKVPWEAPLVHTEQRAHRLLPPSVINRQDFTFPHTTS